MTTQQIVSPSNAVSCQKLMMSGDNSLLTSQVSHFGASFLSAAPNPGRIKVTTYGLKRIYKVELAGLWGWV